MAKKGGLSEINGFISVNADKTKANSIKSSKKDAAVTNIKKRSTSTGSSKTDLQKVKTSPDADSKKKDIGPDLNKSRKVNENETAKLSKGGIPDPRVKKVATEEKKIENKVSKTNVSVKTNRSTTQNSSSLNKPSNIIVNKVKSGSGTNSKVVESKSTKIQRKVTVESKDKTSLSGRVKETKITNSSKSSSLNTKVMKPQTSDKALSSDKPAFKSSQSKLKPTTTSTKEVLTSKRNDESTKKPAKAKPSSNIAQKPQENKKANKINESNLVGNSNRPSKPLQSSKIQQENKKSKSNDKKKVEYAATKISSKEITNINVKDDNLPTEKLNMTSSYKDLIYFEVDMGNKQEKTRNVVNVKEVVEPVLQFNGNVETGETRLSDSAKTSISRPVFSAVSRQGTFTKDDIDSNNDSLNLPQINNTENAEEKNDSASDNEYDYEDDFEDYESDFEEYVSESGVSSESESSEEEKISQLKHQPSTNDNLHTESKKNLPKGIAKTVEEEKKLDSGNYDLTSKVILPQSLKEKQLAQIKEAISRENSLYSERSKNIVEPVAESNNYMILDFLSAVKTQEVEEGKKNKKSRSAMILGMIDLHVQDIAIFEKHFVTLDDADAMYKDRNVSHVGSEAEVFMRNQDIQTEEIKARNKWTQFPITYHNFNNSRNPLEAYVEDNRGFGGDNITVDLNSWINPYYNPEKFYNFIESVGQFMLVTLEEEERLRADESISVQKAKHDHGFSRGYIPIQTKNLNFLKSRPICDVIFSPHNPNVFLSSHRFVKDIENLPSFEDQFLGRSVLCLWNILEPSQPLAMMVASCQASATCFDIVHRNLIYAGLTDGSVCLWDTTEHSVRHKETVAGSMDYLLRTPTYCSSHLFGDEYHNNVVVAMQSLGCEIHTTKEYFSPTQVVTLDADGKLIVWVTVITAVNSDYNIGKHDYGQVYWGRFKLVASRTLKPSNLLPSAQNTWSLQFICMNLAPDTNRSVLIGTNTSCVLHCLLTDEKPCIPVYIDGEELSGFNSVTAIERNPHKLQIFMAGCSNGTVRIHMMDKKRPIKVLLLDSQLSGAPVARIKWSLLGAGHFFVSDKSLSLHIWDLCKQETSPLLSLSLKKLKATHYDISSDKKYVYMVLVVHKDRLEIHRLKEQFTPEGLFPNEKDRKKFLMFVDKYCI